MKLCCEKLVAQMYSKGEKGACILARNEELHRGFIMQFRPFTPDEIDFLTLKVEDGISLWDDMSRMRGRGVTLSSYCNLTLRNCPYCGTNFSVLIENDKSGFDELVDTDRRFVAGWNPLGSVGKIA